MTRLIAAATSALSLLSGAPQQGGLTIRVTVPAGTPANAAVYVAGTFNSWDPRAGRYRMTCKVGHCIIVLPDSVRGPIEFKLTLGSWDRVEVSAQGGDVANRSFTVPPSGAATYTGSVAAWRSGSPAPRAHTARPSVAILDTAFAIPQLGRARRLWVYLPPDYATSRKAYPVLYLADGQNVFDAATSFAGEWGVDETLDSLRTAGDAGVIVVAVDNGGNERLNEYLPWPSTVGRFGGDGSKYAEFVVRTLKPFVDGRFRTEPGRASTGIGGSSAGGIISVYAALQYPDVFGRVLAFSTPFFMNPQLFSLARTAGPRLAGIRFYLDSGLNEGVSGLVPERTMARSQRAMVDTLAAAGVDTAADVRSLLPADGAHAEWFWRREFPAAYRWLFAEPARAPGGPGR